MNLFDYSKAFTGFWTAQSEALVKVQMQAAKALTEGMQAAASGKRRPHHSARHEQRLMNWLRMEKWIADRPDHPGEAAKRWMKDLYQQNKLVRNEWELDGRRVDLGNIRMPVLNVYAKASRALGPLVARRTMRSWRWLADISACSSAAGRKRCSRLRWRRCWNHSNCPCPV
jgi:hypothetical protein